MAISPENYIPSIPISEEIVVLKMGKVHFRWVVDRVAKCVCVVGWRPGEQGYLAQKEHPPRRTLQ